MNLSPIDSPTLVLYLRSFLGWLVRRRFKSSEDFLASRRSVLTCFDSSLAFIAASLGAQEAVGVKRVRIQRIWVRRWRPQSSQRSCSIHSE